MDEKMYLRQELRLQIRRILSEKEYSEDDKKLLEDAANQQIVLEERSNHLRLLIRKIVVEENRLGDLGKELPESDRKILEATANAEIVKEERTLFEKQLKNREKDMETGENNTVTTERNEDVQPLSYVPINLVINDDPPPGYDVDPNKERFDSDLLRSHQEYLNERCTIYGLPQDKLGMEHTQAMKLLKIMDEHGCPRVMYDKLRSWCEETCVLHVEQERIDNGGTCPISRMKPLVLPPRSDLFKTLEERYNMQGLRPKMIPHVLPKSRVKVELATFDFQEMVKSLLTHPDTACDGNWAFPDPDDPYCPPKKWAEVEADPEAHELSDLHQGEWYSETYYMKCQHQNRDVLLPIILFIDKTHTDATGRLKQEPVLFTLGCFSLKTRSNPKAWRLLGYIRDMASLNITQSAEDNMNDYHSMLRVLLSGLIQVQQAGGFRWNLCIKGKEFPVVFRCCVPFVCGDNEGLNKLCGRYGSNTGIQSLCRFCKIPTEEIGSTHEQSHPLIYKKDIEALRNNPEEQKKLSHYCIDNAFELVDFGCNNLGGIHHSSPFDLLHCRRIGTQPRLCECILCAKKLNQHAILAGIQSAREKAEQRRKEEEKEKIKSGQQVMVQQRKHKAQIQIDFDIDYDASENIGIQEGETNLEKFYAVVTEKLTEEEEAKIRIFSPEFCKKVDRMARYWGKVLQHQSDRTLGRTHFPHGITKNTKIAGHERPGVLLLYLLVFVSTFGSQYFETASTEKSRKKKTTQGGEKNFMSSERRADFIFCLEEELLMDYLLRSDRITLHELDTTYKEYIPMSMERYEKTLNWRQGVGCNFLKFHWAIHIVCFLKWWGCI
jgi:hypothetical protein